MMKEETDKESGAEEQHSAKKQIRRLTWQLKSGKPLIEKSPDAADQENENLHKTDRAIPYNACKFIQSDGVVHGINEC